MSGYYTTEIIRNLHPYALRNDAQLRQTAQSYSQFAQAYVLIAKVSKVVFPILGLFISTVFGALNPQYLPLILGGIYLLFNPTIDLCHYFQEIATKAVNEVDRCQKIRQQLLSDQSWMPVLIVRGGWTGLGAPV